MVKIVIKRFLDHVSNNKVLGVYKINYDALTAGDEKLFSDKLKKLLPKYDIIVVSDYGHGFISKKSSKIICKHAKYLALNAQVNAANVGYHSMRNYKNVDCVSPMRGGHRLDLFENEIEKTNLIKETDIDITLETAPTWDFLNKFLNEVAIPISDMSHSYIKYKYPKLIRFIKWKYRNRLDKIRKIWLSNELTGENFAKFKSYRLFLFKK